MNIEHDEKRERDLQTLAKAVVSESLFWVYESNSYDRWKCVFCYEDLPDNSENYSSEQANNLIEHSFDCHYSFIWKCIMASIGVFTNNS